MLGSSVVVDTNDYQKAGTYNLRLVGSIGSFTSAYISFTVNIINPCDAAIISPSSVSDMTYYTTTS